VQESPASNTARTAGSRAGKNLGFLKKVFKYQVSGFWFLGFVYVFSFFCTKTEHESTTQKHMKNIPYAVRRILLKINTKNCSLSIVLTATDQKPQKSLKR